MSWFHRLQIVLLVAILTICTMTMFIKYGDMKSINSYIDESYNDTIEESVDNYNDGAVRYLRRNYINTNAVISPLAIEYSVWYYMTSNNIVDNTLFHIYKDGVVDFESSGDFIKSDGIDCITFGQGTKVADIQLNATDKLTIDEVNAKIKTFSDGSVNTLIDSSIVYNYNILAMCVIDGMISSKTYAFPEGSLKDTGSNYIVSDKLNCFLDTMDNFYYVELPIKDSDYVLVLVKGNWETFSSGWDDKNIGLQQVSILVPELSMESISSPISALSTTEYETMIQSDINLNSLIELNHLKLTHKQPSEEFEGNIYVDFSSNCIFMIKDVNTGRYVMLGNLT